MVTLWTDVVFLGPVAVNVSVEGGRRDRQLYL